MSNVTRVGNMSVEIKARQAVLDTGSSVITASTIDANTINSVSEPPAYRTRNVCLGFGEFKGIEVR